MISEIRCDGIYDLRTLTFLKKFGFSKFSFDFSPTSLNFLPEYLLFEKLLPEIELKDEFYFYFDTFDPLMITRLSDRLDSNGINQGKVRFEFRNVGGFDLSEFKYEFIINYSNLAQSEISRLKNCVGFSLDYSLLDSLNKQNNLQNFFNNFYYRLSYLKRDQIKLICNLNVTNSIESDIFNFFEFDFISFKIDSSLESCYRNVNLNKLAEKINKFRQYQIFEN